MASNLLQVVVDLNVTKLTEPNQVNWQREDGAISPQTLPLQILFDSVIKFLNAYHIQSALNKYRLYVALPAKKGSKKLPCTQLLFPCDEDDKKQLLKFKFEDIRDEIYKRLGRTLEVIAESEEEQKASMEVDQVAGKPT